jgi:diguanylate cyclase (GGDEF)-like protein
MSHPAVIASAKPVAAPQRLELTALLSLEAAGDLAFSWDIDGDQLNWVGAMEEFFDQDLPTPASMALFDTLMSESDALTHRQAITRHLAHGDRYECQYRLHGRKGASVWVHERGQVKLDSSGRVTHVYGTLRTIDELKSQEAKLIHYADYDDITGHYNKRRLRESLDKAVNYVQHFSTTGAYLVVGIDRFSVINECYGFRIGDKLLNRVAQRLLHHLRIADIMGRVDGDRFGLILYHCTEDELVGAAERFIRVIAEEIFNTEQGAIPLTASVGGIIFPTQGVTATELMARAEIALQQAKRKGSSSFAKFKPMVSDKAVQTHNLALQDKVRRALQNKDLCLAYQPLVDATTHQAVSHECLLRMKNPDGTMMPAAEFIPVIEKLGLIRQVDWAVMDMALDELRAHPDLDLGINVSPANISDGRWLKQLMENLAKDPSLAKRLVVEITETAAMDDLEQSSHFVNALKKSGCRIALDDFGAGFTSLRELQYLPVDILKIDRDFVKLLPDDAASIRMVQTLVGLASDLSLVTVAEGVENVEQANLLKDLGVAVLQGYYFGRPTTEPSWQTVAAKT